MTGKAVIKVFKINYDWPHPYPWRFTIIYKDKEHQFCGIPNQCASRHSAFMRARWRAKWLEDGSFDSRYQQN